MIQTPNKVKRKVMKIPFISMPFSFLFYSLTTTVADSYLWGYISDYN